jgi:hypothetical protein
MVSITRISITQFTTTGLDWVVIQIRCADLVMKSMNSGPCDHMTILLVCFLPALLREGGTTVESTVVDAGGLVSSLISV